jgi:DNA-binding MarR family transcriptional regulator
MPTDEPDDYALDPVLDFLRVLWGVEHGLQRASKRMESGLGITGPQRLVLRVVGKFPGLSAGELAYIVSLHPSTITGILQRLVDRGLITRERDANDNRRVRLQLKPSARAFTRTSRGTVEHAVTQALRRVTPAQVQSARQVLTALADALHLANEGDAKTPVRGTSAVVRRPRATRR